MPVTKIELTHVLEDCEVDPSKVKDCKINEDGELWVKHDE